MGAIRPGMAVPVIRACVRGERAGRIDARHRVSASRASSLGSDRSGTVRFGPAGAFPRAAAGSRGGSAPGYGAGRPARIGRSVVARGSAVRAVRGNVECVARRRADDAELSDDAIGKALVAGRLDATLGPVGRSG